MEFETARLVIRTFEPRDAEPWLAMTDADFRRFLPAGPAPTLETFRSAIEHR
jgi:RimJ/RimL family protein N-acetyltransferase